MTTKPKAKKFRIRRNTPEPAAKAPSAAQETPVEKPQQAAKKPEAAPPQPEKPTPPPEMPTARDKPAGLHKPTAQDIDEIRKENLTGRQLRMARRMAQKHGLAPVSDFDAVRLLRAKGVDPFHRASILEVVGSGTQEGDEPTKKRVQLPQTVPAEKQALPSTDLNRADQRAAEIMAIQRDIGKRRRRKLLLLLSRLTAFVFLPTLIAGIYYYIIATPMYATKSEFLILTADGGSSGGAGGLGGLLPSQFATGQDSIATQSYLQSKDAMLRLDADLGFRDHFSQDHIDPIQRLDPGASNEEAYKLYKKYIKLGYDPTEGVIRMELSTADPEVSALFSQRLIDYAEERVDSLSREKRLGAVETAEQGLAEAKAERRAAQERMVSLQEGTILDPEGEIAGIRQLVSTVELQLQEKQLALDIQLNNPRPNKAKVDALESQIAVLSAELDKQKARLNQATEGASSLASQTAEIQMAQADLATADLVLQAALETKRLSEIEAHKQVRYLTVSVRPVASQDPSYPRAFENTMLAFLIFAGIYLMISLTVSILKEQVSS